MTAYNCITPENHKKDKDKKPIAKKATQTRPPVSHISGDISAQQLCDNCADAYDKYISEKQQQARDQRKQDLEKRTQKGGN